MVKLIIFSVLAAIATINAIVVPRAPTPGKIVTVESDQVFCSFLPKTPGQTIGASEGTAIAFCTQQSSNADGAKIFPEGFIKSSHFKQTDNFVQVTGTMDGSKYSLDPSDGGGQYDSVGAPPDAVCTGFNKFVNLVEPNDNIYCIRCCKNPRYCDTSRSEDGCKSIIPGDYS